MDKIKVLVSQITNPWQNLAVEDWYFRNSPQWDQTLFIWQNNSSVILGKFQQAQLECDLKYCSENGILLARRSSGGGSVYHDLGNLNFTFISKKESYDKKSNFKIVLQSLKKLGIKAIVNERNDILLDGLKISGNAFKNIRLKSLHHGTILFNSNLDHLTKSLVGDSTLSSGKWIRSVKSKVKNLIDRFPQINYSLLKDELINSFFEFYRGNCRVDLITQEGLAHNSELLDSMNKYRVT